MHTGVMLDEFMKVKESVGGKLEISRPGSPNCAFYIVAHPDDIELFMAFHAWSDIASSDTKTVFVVLTAGDAGQGISAGDSVAPYYLAREIGHERAIRFWANLNGVQVHDTNRIDVTIARLIVQRQSISERIVFYNLRLPDGGSDGFGYSATGNQSLSLLRSGKIDEIRSIDNAVTFTRQSLRDFIQGLIAIEAHRCASVWVNIQDEDNQTNPSDHPDHIATAETVLEAISDKRYSCVGISRYTTYVNAGNPENLGPSDSLIHLESWKMLNAGMVDGGHTAMWDTLHASWLGKLYFRTQRGRTACGF